MGIWQYQKKIAVAQLAINIPEEIWQLVFGLGVKRYVI